MVRLYNGDRPDEMELLHCPRLRHKNFIEKNEIDLARRKKELAGLYLKYGKPEENKKMMELLAKKINCANEILARRECELADLYRKYGQDKSKMEASIAGKITVYENIVKSIKEQIDRMECKKSDLCVKMAPEIVKRIANYERIIKNLKESLARTKEHMNLPNKYGR